MDPAVEEVIEDFVLKAEQIFESNGSDESLLEEILAIILLLFLLGAEYDDEGDLTPQDREWLDEMYQMSVASVQGMIERNQNEVDMEATVTRLRHHVTGAYSYSYMVLGTDEGQMYEWVLGEADHCGDCVGYSSLGPMPGAFWQDVAENRGHYPQSPQLECRGLHCPCLMQEAQ